MKIIIVIVTYEQNFVDCPAFETLKQNFSQQNVQFRFLIYDNSKNKSKVDMNQFPFYIKYIWDDSNGGVSKAYNVAAKYAIEKGYDWILIADQDTYFPKNALVDFQQAVINNPGIKLFIPKIRLSKNGKFMSPVKNNFFFNKPCDRVPTNVIDPGKYAIINSGMLINVDAFWKTGGYNEMVWLDYSDYQFIERFSNYYDKAYVIESECIQSFSNDIPDISQKINRFKLFCSSVKHYKALKRLNKFKIDCSVFKRALSLTIQSKDLRALIIFIKVYLR